MRRQPNELKTKGTRVLNREGARAEAAKRSRLRRLALEGLEQRTLMATAPLPVVSNQLALTSNPASSTTNDSSPTVAIDPVNPLKMVMVYTDHDPGASQITATPYQDMAQYTTDGGKTWQPLALPLLLQDPSVTNTFAQYTQGFAQGVGMDQNQLLYIGVLESDGANTSGAVVTEKFDFSTGTPVQINVNGPGAAPDNVIYQWDRSATGESLQPSFDNFTLAVDSNVSSFMDPTTGDMQADPNAGDVYIAGTVDSPPPPNPPSPWNRYVVYIGGSTDGINFSNANGLNFTPVDSLATQPFGDPNVGPQHETDPQIAISQGKVGGADGGELTVLWDDYGSGAAASPPLDELDVRGMKFDSTNLDFNYGVYDTAATTLVRGNLDLLGTPAPYPVASSTSPLGIGPGAQIAVDNTLGSFSQYQGRIYITYVNRPDYTDPDNPTDNTDIFLISSDDDGKTWSQPTQVNDDNSIIDGYSSAATEADELAGYAQHVQGRPQFMPSIAIDPDTGTVGIAWYDARNDASDSRVATFVTESIDGGQTFSPQTYVNPPNSVTDAITGEPVSLGPIADNQSPGNPNTDKSIGFGIHQTLIFADGALRPFWAANNDGNNGQLLGIETASVTYPAGPRIISSTMGAVTSTTVNGMTFNNAFSPTDHTPELEGFTITFDRPVDVASISGLAASDQIKAYYNSPYAITNTPVPIGSVMPLDSYFGGVEATTFFVAFLNPQTAVGTYSYSVGNYSALATTSGVQDDMRNTGTVQITSDGTNTVSPAPPDQVGQTIPPYNFGDSQTTSTIDITTASPSQLVQSLTVSLDVTFNYDGDLVFQLTSPTGVTVTLIANEGGAGQNFQVTTLSDAATQPIGAGTAPFNGTYAPESPLNVFADEPVDGAWTLNIFDTVNDPNDTGTLNGWSLDIAGETKTFVLGATGNKMDQNANGIPGQLDDSYLNPAPLNAGSTLPPFNTTTLPLIVPGPNVVSVFVPSPTTGAAISSGPDNLVLNQPVTALDVTFDRNMQPVPTLGLTGTLGSPTALVSILGPNGLVTGTYTITNDPQPGEDASFPRTFRITFPSQSISGTYSVQISPSPQIVSESGYEVDANEHAGVALLFDQGTGTSTETKVYAAASTSTGSTTNLGVVIPANGTVTSTLTINDSFLIQSILLGLNITYPNDPDLVATITAPNFPTPVVLFSHVGNIGAVGTRRNFTNTVFTDSPTNSSGGPTTPIGNGAPPFVGQFLPADPALFSELVGTQANGTWTLTITNTGTTAASVGTLNAWSLSLGEAIGIGPGLGDIVADRTTESFRIFTMDPTNPLSSGSLTPVGPAAINNNDNAGSASVVAIDPVDPTGNTAYVGGASGGVWKTTDFLTTSPLGPTYVPLTNDAPVNGVNVGSIAIFDRNNDPNQSVILVGTGNGDLINPTGRHGGAAISQGAGFLISYNGGQTWTVLNSLTNSINGVEVPEAQRDKTFVGASVDKVLIDPRLTPQGTMIFYAAVSSTAAGVGGVYRSTDSGATWTQVRAGDATDIVFDPNSDVINAVSNPTGNIRTLYAAFAGGTGAGVYMTPNQGQTWSLMSGGLGDPLYKEILTGQPIPVTNNPTVNSPFLPNPGSKVVLAKPALTGNPVLDTEYETWLYAAVFTVAGPLRGFDGLFLTKDNGANWTQVQLPDAAFVYLNGSPVEVVPTNTNITTNNYNVTGIEGTYDLSLAVDPTDPAVVYLGGNADAQPTTLIRVDTTRLADPYAMFTDSTRNDAGAVLDAGSDPVTTRTVQNNDYNPLVSQGDPLFLPYINLYRSPTDPFLANSTLIVSDVTSFTNSGSGALWTPFESFLSYSVNGTPQFADNIHDLVTFVDPGTGLTRLVAATDEGVFTAVDDGNGGVLSSAGIGTVVTGSRNGNLQLAQFYTSASQPSVSTGDGSATPSNVAAGALFYGNSQDNGLVASDPNILDNGNLQWSGLLGSGQGVATDATGSGTSYASEWPCCISTGGGTTTDFFQVNPDGTGYISRTFGLFATNNGGLYPDPQWGPYPAYNFAVNPIDNAQMIMGSGVGRLYGTETQGEIWYLLADVGTFADTNNDAYTIPALTYGAPDSSANGALDAYLLVGTSTGGIFVTDTGGGTNANSNAWTQISSGLDGSAVQQIVTDPTRGTHDAYAVTKDGVYFNANTLAAGSSWVNITSNVFQLTASPFGDANLAQPILAPGSLTSVAVDWRYVIPNNGGSSTAGGATHPMLYVAGNGGIFRSEDNGATWEPFPDQSLDPSYPAGDIPSVDVTSLSLALGNVDPTTGHADVSTGPNILLAGTYGQGAYAIRLAPIVFDTAPNQVQLSQTLPAPGGSDSGRSNTDGITNITDPVITGLSEQSAFGNVVAITVLDVTNPNAPFVAGGYDPSTGLGSASFLNAANQTDAFGNFNVQLNYSNPPTQYGYDGVRHLEIFATDASGTVGNIVDYQFTLQTKPPLASVAPVLDPNSDTSFTTWGQHDNYTSDTTPFIDVTLPNPITTPPVAPTDAIWKVLLYRKAASDPNNVVGVDYLPVGSLVVPNGTAAGATVPVQDLSGNLANGQYIYADELEDVAGNQGPLSVGSATITFDTFAPIAPGAPVLTPGSDSGGNNVTNDKSPYFTVATAEVAPTRTVLLRGTKSDGSNAMPVNGPNYFLGSTTSQLIQDPGPVPDGTYYYFAEQIDLAGNKGTLSTGTMVQILTSIPGGGTQPTINVYPTDLTGGAGSNITNVTDPRFYGTVPPQAPNGQPLTLEIVITAINGVPTNPNAPTSIAYSGPDPSSGNYLVPSMNLTLPMGVSTEVYTLQAEVVDLAKNVDASNPLVLTITKAPPTITPSLQIYGPNAYPALAANAVITGSATTVLRRPYLVGVTNPGVTVSIVSTANPSVVLATTVAGSNGYYAAQLSNNLGDGTITLEAYATNSAGNSTAYSPAFTLNVTTVKGDYNDDGVADLGVYTPPPLGGPQGLWSVGWSGTATTASYYYGLPGDVPIPGDYAGNGTTGLAVYRPSTSQWIINQSPTGPEVLAYGAPGVDTPAPAGYDTNGQTDIAVYSSSIAEWSIIHNGVGGISQTHTFFGSPNIDLPVPADYDGLGHAEIAVYQANNGTWYVLNPATGKTDLPVNLGYAAGDIPVPGDYDGIGRAEPAVYRPGSGSFIVYNPTTNKIETYAVPGATASSIPVPEDYTGSGRIDPAVFNTSAGTWLYLTPTASGFSAQPVSREFAVTYHDIPLPAPYAVKLALIGGGVGTVGSGGSGGVGADFVVAGGGNGGSSGGVNRDITTGGGSGSGSSGSNRDAMVVGASIPGGSTSTGKASSRPNVSISSSVTLLSTAVTKPLSDDGDVSNEALSSLGRSINGRFF